MLAAVAAAATTAAAANTTAAAVAAAVAVLVATVRRPTALGSQRPRTVQVVYYIITQRRITCTSRATKNRTNGAECGDHARFLYLKTKR